MRRGEVYVCDFGSPVGHEPAFRRPAVVVSHDLFNRYGVPIVLPVTRSRRGYPTHVELDGVLPVTSYVQCELIRAVSADRLTRRVAELDAAHLARIDVILRRLLAL
ncbi:MAG TPA: type II toxin-antitoxin system PemK/MazF family toxin [Micromonosporaceae bacterium]|nr:type II toxin-antitoxin system PemK/MazF family toxin [Micromonosporaceae bacterium]